MSTANTDDLNALQTFATLNNELPFAHLVTQALLGETWAIERIQPALNEFCFAPCDDERVISIMENTDCNHPTGAIARKFEF